MDNDTEFDDAFAEALDFCDGDEDSEAGHCHCYRHPCFRCEQQVQVRRP